MTQILHDKDGLVIIVKGMPKDEILPGGKSLGDLNDMEYFTLKMNRSFVRDILQMAQEVWAFDNSNRSFESVKNKSGFASLLKSHLANKGINIRCDAATINTGNPVRFRFEDDKDYFLFKLKF